MQPNWERVVSLARRGEVVKSMKQALPIRKGFEEAGVGIREQGRKIETHPAPVEYFRGAEHVFQAETRRTEIDAGRAMHMEVDHATIVGGILGNFKQTQLFCPWKTCFIVKAYGGLSLAGD